MVEVSVDNGLSVALLLQVIDQPVSIITQEAVQASANWTWGGAGIMKETNGFSVSHSLKSFPELRNPGIHILIEVVPI